MLIRLFFVGLCTAAMLLSGCTDNSSTTTDPQQPDPDPPTVSMPTMDPEFSDIDTSNFHERIEEQFSLEHSLWRSQQIRDALDSFRQLTEISRDMLPAETLNEIGNTGWEFQNLGFHNWHQCVHGTLLKQEYQIRRLELKLELWKHEIGNSTDEELAQKQAAYDEAVAAFQQFIDEFFIVD